MTVDPAAGHSTPPPASPGTPRPTDLSIDDLYSTSTDRTTLTGEAADRVAIRELVDAWGHFADRRLAHRQADLFVPHGVLRTYTGEPTTHEPTGALRGQAEIEQAVGVLAQYELTTHVNTQQDLVVRGDRAVGELHCQAHHVWRQDGQRMLTVMYLRYHDLMVRRGDRWLFEDRALITDWTDTRPSKS